MNQTQRNHQDYEDFVRALFKTMETPAGSLMHAAVGISGEAGEILDNLKKHGNYIDDSLN
jgi:hypothetical protein